MPKENQNKFEPHNLSHTKGDKQMIKRRILFLVIFLMIPASVFAQTSAQANKSWNSFWTQFTAAVNSKNKAAVKRLMAAEKDFDSGGGSENRDQWLRLVEKQNYWTSLQKSVRSGTKSHTDFNDRPTRVTKDEALIFELSRSFPRKTPLKPILSLPISPTNRMTV